MDIIELNIFTDDIFQTEKFYSEILGFNILTRSESSISYMTGTTILTFVESSNQKPVYHFAFNIPNNKLDESLNWINNRIEVMNVSESSKIIDFENWNAKSFYFRDNNENILELIARFDIDNQSDKVYDNSLIQSISEIGIPVDNVLQECEMIKSNYHLEYFAKQIPAENFAALGDDNGLIILAKNNRNWFPTESPSEKHWTKIKFDNYGRTHELEYYAKLDTANNV